MRKLLLQGPRKGGREHGARTLGELARHIHHADSRHRAAVGALGQADLRPTRMLRTPVERLDRRRGAAEHHRSSAATGHPARDLARMVARGAVLLIAALVLLVDDVEPHVGKRGEKRAARTHHHAGRAAADEVPLVVAFTGRHARMHDRHGIAEAAAEAAHRLRGERDLGHEHARRATLCEDPLDGLQIHLGLTRARDAVDEHHVSVGGIAGGGDGVERLRLAWSELRLRRGSVHSALIAGS